MTAVAIFQFVGVGTSSQGHQLVSQADAKNGNVGLVGFGQMLNGDAALFGIARTIGYEESVIFLLADVVVPGHPDHSGIPLKQVSDDVVFYPAIDQQDPVFALSVYLLFTHTDLGNQVIQVGIVGFRFIVLKNHLPEHGSFFT